MIVRVGWLVIALMMATVRAAWADGDSTGQFWANVTMTWHASPRTSSTASTVAHGAT